MEVLDIHRSHTAYIKTPKAQVKAKDRVCLGADGCGYLVSRLTCPDASVTSVGKIFRSCRETSSYRSAERTAGDAHGKPRATEKEWVLLEEVTVGRAFRRP